MEKVKKDIVPKTMFDPIFKTIATIITKIKRNGSIHDVVVSVRISHMITIDMAIAMVISLVIEASRSLLDTALPAKQPRSFPTIR